jgi:steroid delta-isomerase-like uncharacterized protein
MSDTKMVQEWIDAWSAHDLPRLQALFTEGCVYEDVTMAVVNNGLDELGQFATAVITAMPDVNFKLVTAVADGDRAAAEWRMIGTYEHELAGLPAPNGGHFDLRGMSIFEIRGGRFSRCSDHWDMVSLLRQLGYTS